MTKGKFVNKDIQQIILNLKKKKKTINEIFEATKVSKRQIYRIISNGKTKPKKNVFSKLDPRRIINEKVGKKIINLLKKNNKLSSKEILKFCNLNCSCRTMRRWLSKNGYKSKQLKAKVELTDEEKQNRIVFGKSHNDYTKYQWNKIFFSDEKKFNLRGPDGYDKAWIQKNEKKVYVKKNHSYQSIMVWAAISYKHKTPLFFIEKNMNSEFYVEMIGNFFLPEANSVYGDNFLLQQDNASVHRSKFSMETFEDWGIKIFNFPTKSPDLSPIENMWSLLSQRVYNHGRTYKNLKDLKNSLTTEWNQIDQKMVKKLINSMPIRMKEVIQTKGDATHY